MTSSRREFLHIAGAALAGTPLAAAQQAPMFANKQIQTRVLDIGYEESGPAQGFPVILLHGFPDDVRAWDGVVPELANAGNRVLVPYLRGYGPTRFRDPAAPRMAEQAAIGQDVIDFADALALPRFAVAGFDWGGRAACIAAALHPERVRAGVFIGGYLIQDTISQPAPAPPEAGLAKYRRPLCRLLWQLWSPGYRFTDEVYERTAASFDNPDFVDIVIHSYRHRNLNAPGEPRFQETERKLAQRPKITVPSIVLHGADDGIVHPPADSPAERVLFTGLVARRVIEGAGHFLPREKPEAVSSALLELLAANRL
jgi:pimeloyl-ACP methyl ester carboxylesterase